MCKPFIRNHHYNLIKKQAGLLLLHACSTVGRKGVCFLCSKHEEIALFSATAKRKPAGASPDYYKAIGNYLCADSRACNRSITDVAALEKFMQDVLGQRQ